MKKIKAFFNRIERGASHSVCAFSRNLGPLKRIFLTSQNGKQFFVWSDDDDHRNNNNNIEKSASHCYSNVTQPHRGHKLWANEGGTTDTKWRLQIFHPKTENHFKVFEIWTMGRNDFTISFLFVASGLGSLVKWQR